MPKLMFINNSGSIEDSQSIEFEIADIPNEKGARVSFENATHQKDADISGYGQYIMLNPHDHYATGRVNLSIPEHSSDAIVTIFASIEEPDEKGQYQLTNVLSSVYQIDTHIKAQKYKGRISFSESYVGKDQRVTVFVEDKPNTRVVLNVNDRRTAVHTNDKGLGSISFYGKDIMGDDDSTVLQKFPAYVHTSDDEFIEPKFTGSFLNCLPDKISTLESCESLDISDCVKLGTLESTEVPDVIDNQDDLSFKQVPSDLPAVSTDCDNQALSIAGNLCSISKYAADLTPYGLIAYAIAAQDSGDTSDDTRQMNRIFLAFGSSSLEQAIFGTGGGLFNTVTSGIIQPTTSAGELRIQVSEELYNIAQVGQSLIIFSSPFDGNTYPILQKDISEDGNFFLVFQTDVVLNSQQFCSNFLYIGNCTGVSVNAVLGSLPFMLDVLGNPVTAANPAVAVSPIVNSQTLDAHMYVVAEGLVEGVWQLFLFTIKFSIDSTCGTGSTPQTFGWVQLTSDGENKNPKIKADSVGNLQVVWESDRLGQTQLYYGALGPSSVSLNNGATSAFFDKRAHLLQSDNKPFDYVDKDFFLKDPDTQYFDPVYGTFDWIQFANTAGDIRIPQDDRLQIAGNPAVDQALAVTSLSDESTDVDWNEGKFEQFNYQIVFNLKNNNDLQVLSQSEITRLYDQWKGQFTPVYDSTLDNISSYDSGLNKFQVGRRDSLYERIIPIVGSYKNPRARVLRRDGAAGTNENFHTVVNGENQTVKHFVLGLMPEKVQFKAENRESLVKFADENNLSVNNASGKYTSQIESIINTGRYRLAILLNNVDFVGNVGSSDYGIVRRFSKPFDLINAKEFRIITNYTKMTKEDVASLRGVNPLQLGGDLARFWCNISILLNDEVIFVESFMTDFSDKYRSFDIGFGFPGGGQHRTNEFLWYESNVFDDLDVDLEFSNVLVGSPTYMLRRELINIPDSLRSDDIINYTLESKLEDEASFYSDNFDLFTFGLTASGTVGQFPQVPLTVSGINKEPSIALGSSYDLHIAWQSNRDKFWNIFYTSSINRHIPYRFETQITNTESNSTMPSLAISRTGARMVAWHDNRDAVYQVYAATSPKPIVGPSGVLDEDICADIFMPDRTGVDAFCEIPVEFCFEGCCFFDPAGTMASSSTATSIVAQDCPTDCSTCGDYNMVVSDVNGTGGGNCSEIDCTDINGTTCMAKGASPPNLASCTDSPVGWSNPNTGGCGFKPAGFNCSFGGQIWLASVSIGAPPCTLLFQADNIDNCPPEGAYTVNDCAGCDCTSATATVALGLAP